MNHNYHGMSKNFKLNLNEFVFNGRPNTRVIRLTYRGFGIIQVPYNAIQNGRLRDARCYRFFHPVVRLI
jgi:hypothetical protein